MDRRREFELCVAQETEEEQQKAMSQEFDLATETVTDEDDMVLSPISSPAYLDICTSAGLGGRATTSEGDGVGHTFLVLL